METPDTSIKRAPRTYGRRREPDASDVDAALTAGSSASSNQSSPAFSESGRDVPPSSDVETSFNLADDDDVDDAPGDDRHMLIPQHNFDRKRKMIEIDSKYNDDDMEDVPPPHGLGSDSEGRSAESDSRPIHGVDAGIVDTADDEDAPLPKALFRRSVKDDLAKIDMAFDKAAGAESHKDGALPLSADIPDDPFGSPLPILRADSQPADTHTSFPISFPSTRLSRVARRKAAVHASEDGEDSRRSSPQTSPSALHPISTPSTASSQTPPTTQEMVKTKHKGKQRSESPAEVDADELPALGSSKTHGKGKGRRKGKEKRVKAPTRKEQLETQKTTARIKAEQTVSLARETKPLRTAALFIKYSAKVDEELPPSRVRENPSESSLSDQIEQFSSPAHVERPPIPFVPRPSALRGNPFRSWSATVEPKSQLQFVQTGLLGGPSSRPSVPPSRGSRALSPSGGGLSDAPADVELSSEDDQELPDVSTLLQQEKEKKTAEEKRAKLREVKLRLAANQKQVEVDNSSDIEIIDNDMHVVAREEDEDRKAMKARHIRPSIGRKNQLALAGRAAATLSPSKASPVRRARQDLHVLQAAAAPAFSAAARAESRKGKDRAAPKVSSNNLNAMLLKASERQSRELTLQKEREFYHREGLPRDRMLADEEIKQIKKERIDALVQKSLLISERRELAEDGDDEAQADEESDGDWTPAPEEDGTELEDEEGDENAMMVEAHATRPDDSQAENDQENVRHNRSSRRHLMVVDSDEDDENLRPSTGRVLVADSSLVLDDTPMFSLNHRSSVSSFSDRLEEGTDKENDARLMFDRGEDKENTTVAASQGSAMSPLGPLRARGSLFSLDTPGPPAVMQSQERTPLQELPAEDDDDVFLSSPTRPPLRLHPSTSRDGTPGPLRPQGEKTQAMAAFFQPSFPINKGKGRADEPETPCSLEPAADIDSSGGGFSQFFQATLKNTLSHASMGRERELSDFFTPGKSLGSLGKDKMSLSLGSTAMPSLRVDEERVRKANELFEKDQEVVAELAVAENSDIPSSMFVNEYGFLTQSATGPALPAWALLSSTSPLFAQSSPAIQAGMSVLKSTAKQRQPLGTLLLDVEEGQDLDSEKPRRLRKRASTPDTKYRASMSPSAIKGRNAFDVLSHNQGKIRAPKFPKKKLEKNAFIEGEAEESDEDAGFGFGITKKDDEEELDGEDQDKILEELVDDAEMDDGTLNEEKVLEKVQEHRDQDDAADEKIARDAAEGKMRIKRRNRLLDFEDEESDDEDEDARRRRQRMAKKRKIDGDTLEQLAGNPETQAFVRAYRAEIDDDNEEFAHLDHDEMSLTFIGGNDLEVEEHDEDDDENEPLEVVSADRLREELRKVARGEEEVKTIDTNDVDWVIQDDDEDMADDTRIKEIAKRPTVGGAKPGQMEWEPIQQSRRGDSTQDLSRQQKWARSEGGSRNAGTGRASAVTGIAKSVKAGGGSLTGRRTESGQSRNKTPAKLNKTSSILSAVSSRRSKFA